MRGGTAFASAWLYRQDETMKIRVAHSGKQAAAVTLKDVAAAAGVDVSTASRVLNDNVISIRPETRQRILDTAVRLRYVPNASARALKLRRTGTVGMLLPDFGNPVYASIVRGAMAKAEELGYVMLMAEIGNEEGGGAIYQRLVSEGRIDGLVVAATRESGSLAAELRDARVPHVFANRRAAHAPSVTVSDDAGAAVAAAALAEAGHTRLGVLSGPPDIDTAQRRRRGFAAACAELGLGRPVVEVGPHSAPGGYEAAKQLLTRQRIPTGIFAANLLMGVGALAALREAGLDVPGDVSMIAYNDGEIAEYTAPALTTVRMPLAEMGARAVEVLDAILLGQPADDVVVATLPELIVRKSVGSPPH